MENLVQLQSMGFSLESSQFALEISNNNVDNALDFLLNNDNPTHPQPPPLPPPPPSFSTSATTFSRPPVPPAV